MIIDKDNLVKIFEKTDFSTNMFDDEYNMEYLTSAMNILDKYNNYEKDIFRECKIMIDIFCLQELYQIALRLSLEEEGDIDIRVGSYEYILDELEIDFRFMIILAGKDFLESEFYDEDDDTSNINLLKFLIYENYSKVLKFLKRYFKSNQELLEFIIKNFNIYTKYNELKYDNLSINEFMDYPEIMRLYSWSDYGFDSRG